MEKEPPPTRKGRGGWRFVRVAIALGLLSAIAKGHADPAIGDRWSPFQMVDAAGRTVQWRPGRVTIVSFCAFWCDTWKVQVPRLVEAQSTLKGLPVDFVTISTDGRWAEVAKNNGGLPLWRDAGGEWSHQAGVNRVPTTVVIDKNGKLVYANGGIVRRDDVVLAARKALAGSQPEAGTAYLTFDDFPPSTGGENLLDALRATGAKATLFCLGSRLEAQADLIRRAVREGHSVQCHSWDHDHDNPKLDRCHAAFRRVLGHDFTLYRGPGSEAIVGLTDKPFVVDPYDFTRPGITELTRRILSSVRPGCEIQLHAGVQETIDALPEIVRRLHERGFSLDVLR